MHTAVDTLDRERWKHFNDLTRRAVPVVRLLNTGNLLTPIPHDPFDSDSESDTVSEPALSEQWRTLTVENLKQEFSALLSLQATLQSLLDIVENTPGNLMLSFQANAQGHEPQEENDMETTNPLSTDLRHVEKSLQNTRDRLKELGEQPPPDAAMDTVQYCAGIASHPYALTSEQREALVDSLQRQFCKSLNTLAAVHIRDIDITLGYILHKGPDGINSADFKNMKADLNGCLTAGFSFLDQCATSLDEISDREEERQLTGEGPLPVNSGLNLH